MLSIFLVGTANTRHRLEVGIGRRYGGRENLPAGRRLAAPLGAVLPCTASWVVLAAQPGRRIDSCRGVHVQSTPRARCRAGRYRIHRSYRTCYAGRLQLFDGEASNPARVNKDANFPSQFSLTGVCREPVLTRNN